MGKITLHVNGQEMTFSKQRLSNLLEKHFSSKMTPTEGEWFEVKPMAIDQKLFKKKRIDPFQEEIRQLILKAFDRMKCNPKKYGQDFRTMMPESARHYKTETQLIEMATKLGDHCADWVEQALEWAQQIANGLSWETLCHNKDTSNLYRLIVWDYDSAFPTRLVGGAAFNDDHGSPAYIHPREYDFKNKLEYAMPLVVLYE